MNPNDRILRSKFDQARIYMGGAASGARASMQRMEVCVASFAMKNGLLSQNKPEFGNRVEPSAQNFCAEGSTQRLSAQHFRSNLQVIYQSHDKMAGKQRVISIVITLIL